MSATDWDEIQARVERLRDGEVWRSLEELGDTEGCRALLEREFAWDPSAFETPVDRRSFLKAMGASLALFGLAGCTRQPEETIVPYVEQPEGIIPGRPQFFATATRLEGVAAGVLVENHMGRPTRLDGNPLHPASLGAASATSQAEVLALYDPDRARVLTRAGEISTWSAFSGTMRGAMQTQAQSGGAGLRILTGNVTSPTLTRQLEQLIEAYPKARWHSWEPVGRANARAGAELAFGEDVNTLLHVDKADVIVSLDADILGWGPDRLRHARHLIDGRRVREGTTRMSRLYVVEPTPSLTGAIADHRWAVRPGAVDRVARALARGVGVPRMDGATDGPDWLGAITKELRAAQGRSLIVAGEPQPPAVHALAHAMNHALGNVGKTVHYTRPLEAQTADLTSLVEAMNDGAVELLVIIDSNPVFTAPADQRFSEALGRVPARVHLGLHADETAHVCHWQVPMAHDLEAWSDARGPDGTVTVLQPLIAPLHDGRSAHELVAELSGKPAKGYDIVRGSWEQELGGVGFESAWRRALHDGVMQDSALDPIFVEPREQIELPPQAEEEAGLVALFRPDPSIHDGRYANIGWLQELPSPFSKLTWDDAAMVAPATARALGLEREQLVVVEVGGATVELPVWILPGVAPDVVSLHLGYGRLRAGRVGTGVGRDVYPLRSSTARWWATAKLTPTAGRAQLATTHLHHAMHGRDLVRHGTLEAFGRDPEKVAAPTHTMPETASLYAGSHTYPGRAWGMSIDLGACIGCNACVIACQAENNIPVVGATEVRRGREMHWLRVDRYFEGSPDAPRTFHQPVPCMHCENAPCEVVCPVAATTHSDEGLNEMTYNRCVGTRYCSNNCPYKVRRFNFFSYTDESPTLTLMRNPDVTVRTRGVMEKCTYCVQRISAARIESRKEGRDIRDGEIVPACGAVCPTRAIVFGDINDAGSEVAGLKAQPHDYTMLTELNTAPRTSYLARVSNPNPELGE